MMTVLPRGSSASTGDEGATRDDHDDAGDEQDGLEPVHGQGAGVGRGRALLGQRPASASTKHVGTNRPSAIATAEHHVVKSVLAPRPAKADPLLFDADAKA